MQSKQILKMLYLNNDNSRKLFFYNSKIFNKKDRYSILKKIVAIYKIMQTPVLTKWLEEFKIQHNIKKMRKYSKTRVVNFIVVIKEL